MENAYKLDALRGKRAMLMSPLDEMGNVKEGEAKGILAVGQSEASVIEAKGLATAKAYDEQKKAIGENGIISIEVSKTLAENNIKLIPDTIISSGEGGSIPNALNVLTNLLMQKSGK